MGQRLVIQIEKYGVPLANAYYHWSAYTESAADLTNEVLGWLEDADKTFKPAQKAAWALYKTGARFNDDELARMKELGMSDEFSMLIDGREANRNEGLISVTEQGMEESIYWEEGRVDIDIGDGEIYFNVLSIESAEDYELVREEWGTPEVKKLPTIDFCEYLEFTPDEWAEFYTRLKQIIGKHYLAASSDRTTVYEFIA